MATKKKLEKKLEARIKELEQLVAERDATIERLSADNDSLQAEFNAFETKQTKQMWSRLFKPVGVQSPPDRARVLYIRYREAGYEKQAARDAVNLNLIEEFPELFAKIPPRKNGVVAFYDDDYMCKKILAELDWLLERRADRFDFANSDKACFKSHGEVIVALREADFDPQGAFPSVAGWLA